MKLLLQRFYIYFLLIFGIGVLILVGHELMRDLTRDVLAFPILVFNIPLYTSLLIIGGLSIYRAHQLDKKISDAK